MRQARLIIDQSQQNAATPYFSAAAESAADTIEQFTRAIERNRFIPTPPQDRNFVGDGDFLAIGCEFLRHFVIYGGLTPTERVLEIGCGIGRMALPLTMYLDPPSENGASWGSYSGFDVVADGIDWCTRMISPAYPNFSFRHLDFYNSLYNPTSSMDLDDGALPYETGSFDFVLMTSVVTHLDATDVGIYLRETARLLAPGGRLFLTAFLVNRSARDRINKGLARPNFDLSATGPGYIANPEHPLAAVAYDEAAFLEMARAAGLQLRQPISHGHWSGSVSNNYQDICVFELQPGVES
jgi:SAM-dependent methyltransferase